MTMEVHGGVNLSYLMPYSNRTLLNSQIQGMKVRLTFYICVVLIPSNY